MSTNLSPEKAPITREVALAYRRTRRSLAAAGVPLQQHELRAVDAAIVVYRRPTADDPAAVAARHPLDLFSERSHFRLVILRQGAARFR